MSSWFCDYFFLDVLESYDFLPVWFRIGDRLSTLRIIGTLMTTTLVLILSILTLIIRFVFIISIPEQVEGVNIKGRQIKKVLLLR